jgi:RES domain-containing protein
VAPGPDAAISARLAEFEASPWSGDVWRHTFAQNPPDRRNVYGARWNPRDVEALYVSLDRATAVAEGDYLVESQPLRPVAKRVIHKLRVSLASVVDLSLPGRLAALGIDDAALVGDDYSMCQSVGAAAAFLHLDGIIVPSVRSPGHNIVILFAGPQSVPEIQILESENL